MQQNEAKYCCCCCCRCCYTETIQHWNGKLPPIRQETFSGKGGLTAKKKQTFSSLSRMICDYRCKRTPQRQHNVPGTHPDWNVGTSGNKARNHIQICDWFNIKIMNQNAISRRPGLIEWAIRISGFGTWNCVVTDSNQNYEIRTPSEEKKKLLNLRQRTSSCIN